MRLTLTALCVFSVGLAFAGVPDKVTDALRAGECRSAHVRYEVLMPSAADPVVYDVNLSTAAPTDTLAPCKYLIRWELPRNGRVSSGFAWYDSGRHVRYRDTRLQEYTFAENPGTFSASGGAVQDKAQFVELLPQYLGRQLGEMAQDSTYTLAYDATNYVLHAVRAVNGYDVSDASYTFDAQTGLPRQIDIIYNPASISEQTVTAYYEWDAEGVCPENPENVFPEVFSNFRTSNFRAESLRGNYMPSFTARKADNDHLTHTRGQGLGTTTVFLFMAAATEGNDGLVQEVSAALAGVPASVKVYTVMRDGATVSTPFEPLRNTGRMVLDCGIAAWPTVIVAGADGVVREVFIGRSQDFATRLAQTLMLQ